MGHVNLALVFYNNILYIGTKINLQFFILNNYLSIDVFDKL
jgi:hypothetical protein